MQLADRVERKCNGQSAAARPPRISSFAAVTSPRPAVSFPPATSRFVRVYPYDRPPRILNGPFNDTEYLLTNGNRV